MGKARASQLFTNRLQRREASKSEQTQEQPRERSRSPTHVARVALEGGTSGKYFFCPADPQGPELRAFMAKRTAKSAAALNKELDFTKADPELQERMLKARSAEWQNWMKFKAVRQLSDQEAEEFKNSGERAIPTRWVDTDKNEKMRE